MISIKGEFYIDNSHKYDYNMFMMKNKQKSIVFCIVGCTALLLGGTIYILFRENTYVSLFASKFISFNFVRNNLVFEGNNFIKYYLADYLWALSLSCGLHTIFKPTQRSSYVLTLIVISVGALFELMQYLNLTRGTGDWWDIVFYLIAGLTANLINFKGVRKNEKSN